MSVVHRRVQAEPGGIAVPSNPTYSTVILPSISIDSTPVTVYGAALAPGSAGLYQIAIQVPTAISADDWPIVASIGGVQSAAATLSVQ